MKASEALCQALEEEGVRVIFGIPGGANLPLYDALYKSNIAHIQARHEQGAGHMAEGYAKASGKIGVAFATSGPGATNLVTAIADAHLDSVPTLFITGQIRSDLLGTDGFQEADILGITMPIVKHSLLVQRAEDIPLIIRQAIHIATSGRPGPVLVDVPTDLLREEIPTYSPGQEVKTPGYKPPDSINIKQIEKAADLLNNAKRPVIYSGGGVIYSGASEELRALVRRGGYPVTSTLMGLGAYPAPDPLWLGMLGMHGTRAANYSIDEADLVFAIGARFDDRITGKLSEFAPQARFIHLDIDPAEINKIVRVDVPITGDVKKALRALLPLIEKREDDLSPWWQKIHAWQKEYPLRFAKHEDNIQPQEAIRTIYEETKGEAIVTSDVGQHQMWTAQFYDFRYPKQWLNSGGLGTMGFALPAAIGAKVAMPQREVVAIAGDGSLPMVCGEMAVASMEGISVKVFIINNESMGMVRQWQELFWDENYIGITTDTYPDWVLLARSFGWQSDRVSEPGELAEKIRETLANPGPALLDIRVRREENCYPMIPPGAAARDMVG
jgi:acetolactate synthase-1/2/3 large subunit